MPRRSFPFFGNSEEEPVISPELQERFDSFSEDGRLSRESLRSLLECTESFCLARHWLPDSFVANIYNQYSDSDGSGVDLVGFNKIARDGLLLKGKLEEYEQAFNGVDKAGSGLISREQLGKLFTGLGRPMSAEELDRIVEEADVGHDGIDLGDFLGLARTHLDLGEVLSYMETQARKEKMVEVAGEPSEGFGEMTDLHSEAELNSLVARGGDVIVQLAFTWCRPCKAFKPTLDKLAVIYGDTSFVKITGNENESTKHYAKDVLRAKISPMFASYSGGQLIDTWTGANVGRFVEKIEASLPSAKARADVRKKAQQADSSLLATPGASK